MSGQNNESRSTYVDVRMANLTPCNFNEVFGKQSMHNIDI